MAGHSHARGRPRNTTQSTERTVHATKRAGTAMGVITGMRSFWVCPPELTHHEERKCFEALDNDRAALRHPNDYIFAASERFDGFTYHDLRYSHERVTAKIGRAGLSLKDLRHAAAI